MIQTAGSGLVTKSDLVAKGAPHGNKNAAKVHGGETRDRMPSNERYGSIGTTARPSPKLPAQRSFSSLVSKSSLWFDPFQSNPANTDTTQSDPTVAALQVPQKYSDAIANRGNTVKLKTPAPFFGAHGTPMNAAAILTSLTVANQ